METKDRVHRAKGILQSAQLMSVEEASLRLSEMKLGIDLGHIERENFNFDHLMVTIQTPFFENEEEDLFTAFAEDNAQVNAFTSFDRTSYLFSATDHIESNIKRLLTMVETPYFTKDTVDKEKGIIAEEIKMYQEQPGYKPVSYTHLTLPTTSRV